MRVGSGGPPSGTLASMLTDPFLTVRPACVGLVQLERRTSLRARVPAALAQAEALVDETLSDCAVQHGAERLASHARGTLFGFPAAASALGFAMTVQERLLDIAWPSTLLLRPELADVAAPDGTLLFRGLRVRVAIVAGVVWLSGGNVLGPAVHRAARLVGLAHGGQTLLDDATRARLDDGAARFVDLGRQPLLGELGRHRVHQALPASLAGRRFPPPRTSDQRGGNPRDDADFVGRQQDVAALEELAELGVRIVSVEGPPGIGKTHLCRQYVRLRQKHRPGAGGTWWVGPGVRELSRLVSRLAGVLGVGLQYAPDVAAGVRQLGRALASRGPTLVALDLLAPTPAVREALEHWTTLAPEVSFLVATPARLKAKGEVAYALGPLGLPGKSGDAAIRDADSIRLFVQRAQRVGKGLPAPEDPDLVEMLVQHEGNPRRIRLLAGMLERCPLEEVFSAGSSGSLDGLLEAAWETLTASEQAQLRDCVGMGERAFDVETLGVAGCTSSPSALAQLDRHGFLERVGDGGAPDLVRYATGAEIRAWVAEQDQHSVLPGTRVDSDAETAPRIPAPEVADVEDTEESEAAGPVGVGDVSRLADHVDGVVAAWVHAHWAAWSQPVEVALSSSSVADLDRAMGRWIDHHDLRHHLPLTVALPLVTSLLARSEQVPGVGPKRLVAMRLSSAELHLRAELPAVADTDLERAAALFDDFDDPHLWQELVDWSTRVARVRGVAPVVDPTGTPEGPVQLAHRALETLDRGDDDDAEMLLRDLVEPRPDRHAVDWAMAMVRLLRRTGRPDEARALARGWVDALAGLGDARAEARAAEGLGWVDYHGGLLQDAETIWAEGLAAARAAGDRRAEGVLLGPAGIVALSRGELEVCRQRLEAAIPIHRGTDPVREGQVTGLLGILDHLSHQPQTARDHYRRALDLIGTRGPHRDGAIVAAFAAALEAELGRLESAEQQWAQAETFQASLRDPDVAATMDQLRLALWWSRAQRFEQSGDSARAAKLVVEARERIAAGLERPIPLPGEARIALARMDRLFGRG